jgi:hypothetical protein
MVDESARLITSNRETFLNLIDLVRRLARGTNAPRDVLSFAS